MKIFGAITTLVFFSCLSFSQTSTGRISGTVSDQAGGAIQGASVRAVNERTSTERAVTSDDHGYFYFDGLTPSTYTLHLKQTGFADVEIKGLTLQVGQEIRQHVDMPVSATSSVVDVEGAADTLDLSSAKLGANVTGREVANLPINGRQVSQMYLLTPGAVNSGSGTYDNIRFSGRSNQENIIRYDGIEATSIVDASPGNLNGETTSNFRL